MTLRDPFYIESDDVEALIALVDERLRERYGQDPTIGAIRRLADLKDGRAIPVLRKALDHANVTVKTDAALALHKFGEEAGLNSLISWLSSEERLVQRASDALEKIDEPKAKEALRKSKRSAANRSESVKATVKREIDLSLARAIAQTAPSTGPSRGCAIAFFAIPGVVVLIIIVWVVVTMNGRNSAQREQVPTQNQTIGTMRQVKAKQLNMRSGPGKQYSVVRVFTQNERIVTIGEPQNIGGELWIQASTPDGQTRGWITRKFLYP